MDKRHWKIIKYSALSILPILTFYYYRLRTINTIDSHDSNLEIISDTNSEDNKYDSNLEIISDTNSEDYNQYDFNSDNESENIEKFMDKKKDLYCRLFDTPYKIQQGLKHIKSIPYNEVGFFNMGYYNNHSFWMKDTLFSLDIIFLNSDMNIVGFIENTTPLSEENLFINRLSYYIIEANSGFVKNNYFKKGDNLNMKFNLITTI